MKTSDIFGEVVNTEKVEGGSIHHMDTGYRHFNYQKMTVDGVYSERFDVVDRIRRVFVNTMFQIKDDNIPGYDRSPVGFRGGNYFCWAHQEWSETDICNYGFDGCVVDNLSEVPRYI